MPPLAACDTAGWATEATFVFDGVTYDGVS